MAKVTTPEVALDSSADLANYISFDLACYIIETQKRLTPSPPLPTLDNGTHNAGYEYQKNSS